MLIPFLIGLFGSLGHCVGMCGGVTLLLSRHGITTGRRLWSVHLGRVTTYGLLGLTVGLLGESASAMTPRFRQAQGALALVAAGIALYFALALLGRMPAPERLLIGMTRRWRHALQHATAGRDVLLRSYLVGLVWGLLPCGLVLTALLPAATAGSPWESGLAMLAFGLGTWPALVSIGWAARRRIPQIGAWSRYAAAGVVAVFGVQMALRGMAASGWIGHTQVGSITLW